MPLLRRNKRAYKNNFGHVLVAAGSPAMLGAACLVSLSAIRAGAGLVTAAIPKGLNNSFQSKLSNAVMTLPVMAARGDVFGRKSFETISKCWHKFSTVAIGPGLGLASSTKSFVELMVKECPLPMVIDADALNVLQLSWLSTKAIRVLTPHPGEFFRLSGLKPETDRERRQSAKDFAVRNNVILVLKGYSSVVASPEGEIYMNNSGNAGMAKAGMGDVLTGIISGLLAQGIAPFKAAKLGVYMHGFAADLAISKVAKFGLMPADVIDQIGNSIQDRKSL